MDEKWTSNVRPLEGALGPAPCPVARSHGQFRYHLQILSPDGETIGAVWRTAFPNFSSRLGVEIAVDVDPLNLR